MSCYTIFWSHMVYFHGHFYLKLPKMIKKKSLILVPYDRTPIFLAWLCFLPSFCLFFMFFVMILFFSLLHFVAFTIFLWPLISLFLLRVTIIVVINWALVSQKESVTINDRYGASVDGRYVFQCQASRNASQCSIDSGMTSSLMKKVFIFCNIGGWSTLRQY